MENKLVDQLIEKIRDGKVTVGKSKVGDYYETLTDRELGTILEYIEANDDRKGMALELMFVLYYLETGQNHEFTEKKLVHAFDVFLIVTASEINVRLGHMKRSGIAEINGDGAKYSLTDKGEGHVLAMMGKPQKRRKSHKTIQ